MLMKFNELYTEIQNIIKDDSIAEQVINIIEKHRYEENKLRHTRQREGIARAKRNGIKCGRKPTPKPKNFQDVMNLYIQDGITVAEAADMLKVSRGIFYRWLCLERSQKYGKKTTDNDTINTEE